VAEGAVRQSTARRNCWRALSSGCAALQYHAPLRSELGHGDRGLASARGGLSARAQTVEGRIPPSASAPGGRDRLADRWPQWLQLAVLHGSSELVPVPSDALGERGQGGIGREGIGWRAGGRSVQRLQPSPVPDSILLRAPDA